MSDFDFALGFIAGEGSFALTMNRTDGNIYPKMRFAVRLHENDKQTLEDCQEIFEGVGFIRHISSRPEVEWIVSGKDELEYIRDKISAYSTDIWYNTQKGQNFEVWSDILDIHIDGRTTAEQTIEMCETARDGLNVGIGVSEEKWDEYIEELTERANRTVYTCGEPKEASEGTCGREVQSKEATCHQH